MKKIIQLILLLLIVSCGKESKPVAQISGEIKNYSSDKDSIKVFIPKQYKKLIAIDKNGKFNDTLNVSPGRYVIQIGDEFAEIFLDNKDDMQLTAQYDRFDETLHFEGNSENVKANNVAMQSLLLQEKYFNDEAFNTSEEVFNLIIDSLNLQYVKIRQQNKTLSPKYWKSLDSDFDQSIKNNLAFYQEAKNVSALNGQKSTGFTMTDQNEKTYRLEDFQGKNVYIDVWATWCGPCKKEIPALKTLENEYENKDLAFVSISIDDPKDKDKWKKFVEEKQLKGIQLMADNAWQSEFVKAYQIIGIPRFILLDKNGNIIEANAPRPSGKDIRPLLDSLN